MSEQQVIILDIPRVVDFQANDPLPSLVARSEIAAAAKALYLLSKDEGERRGIVALAIALGIEIR